MLSVDSFGALQRGRPAAVTIGAFDGIHRGHQFLIRQMVDRARRLEYDTVVVTFNPRPEVVFRPGSTQLTGPEEKARLIGALGPDALAVLPFNRELASVSAGDFLQQLLAHVNVAEMWVGSDFAFGHKRQGTVEFLIQAGQSYGFAVHVVNRQSLGSMELSSTAVRRCLDAGEVHEAAVLLGHYFRLSGVVVTGQGRGMDLGYPTANLGVAETQAIPALGIYAAYAWFDGVRHGAAVSVGTNPTFDGQDITVEPFLLDFDANLRGMPLALDFVEKIRDEVKFESPEALVQQIDEDVRDIRAVLSEATQPGELILE